MQSYHSKIYNRYTLAVSLQDSNFRDITIITNNVFDVKISMFYVLEYSYYNIIILP